MRGKVQEIDWSLEAVKQEAGFTRTMSSRTDNAIDKIPLPIIDERYCSYENFYINFKASLEGKEKFNVQKQSSIPSENMR